MRADSEVHAARQLEHEWLGGRSLWRHFSWGIIRERRVRGKVEFDGLERVSCQTLLDLLVVPQRSRTAGTYRRLAKLMAQLGWTAVRVRDLTQGGYKEQVRGYVRNAL